jgi:Centriolar protein SAS N-terminal
VIGICTCAGWRSGAMPCQAGHQRSPCLQALRVWLSNEADACFLHTLDVSEDDFAGLKAQQGILVDFSGFPGKLIALLDRCAAAAADCQPPRCHLDQPWP